MTTKQEILLMMKKQLRTVTSKLSYQNYQEMEQQVARIFTILESSEGLMDAPVHLESEPVTEELATPVQVVDTKPEVEIIKQEETQEVEEEEQADNIYTFSRKIKAGMIDEIDAFVPEIIIHQLGLSDGDKIRATMISEATNGRPAHYDYELVEKLEPPRSPDNIYEINMGVVSYEPALGAYGIRRTVNSDSIVFNGQERVLRVRDEDEDAMHLREGDIVNAAFYENNPKYMRVRWKYDLNDVSTDSAKPKPASFYKKKDKVDKDVEQIFEGKTICVMGYEPGWASYREEVEKRGGQLLTLTGREAFDTVFGTIDKSNALIMVIGHVGHTGTIFAVDHCKKKNIPQASIKTFGRSSFVEAAHGLLEEKVEK